MKLLLLVQSPDDVQHLDAAARSILNSAITGVWVVFSPAITVDSSEAALKLDSEIENLRSAESAAAQRTDYEAAKGYKVQREGKELDRAKALRDAWKTANADDRKARTKAIFDPFGKTLNPDGKGKISVKVTGHSDHYERDQWVAMLNSLTGVWFKPFTPGSFVIGWPEAVETSIVVHEKPRWAEVVAKAAEPATPQALVRAAKDYIEKADKAALAPKTRAEELAAMHHMSIRPIAAKLNIDVKGKSTEKIIELILAAEAVPAPEPALAEY